MDFKLVLLCALLAVALSAKQAQSAPSPDGFGQLEAKEFPPYFLYLGMACFEDDPDCEKEEKERLDKAEKNHLKELNDWIGRMGPNTKASWREDNPQEAKKYDELTKKFS